MERCPAPAVYSLASAYVEPVPPGTLSRRSRRIVSTRGPAHARRLVFCSLVFGAAVFLRPADAQAQMRGAIAVGAAVSFTQPSADELESGVTVGPTFRTLPVHGWGPAFAFNWYGADLTDPALGTTEKLGRFVSRPLMFGVGYTIVRGRTSISPSVVAGPAFNLISVDDAQRDSYSIDGSSFERRVGKVSLAVRPSLSFTYALRSRLGLTAGISYIVNRPEFTVNTPAGPVETRWRGDALSVSSGVVVSLF